MVIDYKKKYMKYKNKYLQNKKKMKGGWIQYDRKNKRWTGTYNDTPESELFILLDIPDKGLIQATDKEGNEIKNMFRLENEDYEDIVKDIPILVDKLSEEKKNEAYKLINQVTTWRTIKDLEGTEIESLLKKDTEEYDTCKNTNDSHRRILNLWQTTSSLIPSCAIAEPPPCAKLSISSKEFKPSSAKLSISSKEFKPITSRVMTSSEYVKPISSIPAKVPVCSKEKSMDDELDNILGPRNNKTRTPVVCPRDMNIKEQVAGPSSRTRSKCRTDACPRREYKYDSDELEDDV